MKTCPACAEEVQEEAKVCKHCGHKFEPSAAGIGCLIMLAFIVFIGIVVSNPSSGPSAPEPAATARPAVSAEVVTRCRDLIGQAERAGMIRERPAAIRINVEDRLWANTPAGSKRGIVLALACDAFNGEPMTGVDRYVVVYGHRSGKRLAMGTSVGVKFE